MDDLVGAPHPSSAAQSLRLLSTKAEAILQQLDYWLQRPVDGVTIDENGHPRYQLLNDADFFFLACFLV